MNLFPTARRSRRMVSFTGSSRVENSSSRLEEPMGTEMSPSTGMSSEMDTSDSPANGLLASSAAAILLESEELNVGLQLSREFRWRQQRPFNKKRNKRTTKATRASLHLWNQVLLVQLVRCCCALQLHVSWGLFTSAGCGSRTSGWCVQVHLVNANNVFLNWYTLNTKIKQFFKTTETFCEWLVHLKFKLISVTSHFLDRSKRFTFFFGLKIIFPVQSYIQLIYTKRQIHAFLQITLLSLDYIGIWNKYLG